MSRNFRGIPLRLAPLRYSTVPLTTVPLLITQQFPVSFKGLLSKEDHELPFGRHVVAILDDVCSTGV